QATHSLEGCCSIQLSYGRASGWSDSNQRSPAPKAARASFTESRKGSPGLVFFLQGGEVILFRALRRYQAKSCRVKAYSAALSPAAQGIADNLAELTKPGGILSKSTQRARQNQFRPRFHSSLVPEYDGNGRLWDSIHAAFDGAERDSRNPSVDVAYRQVRSSNRRYTVLDAMPGGSNPSGPISLLSPTLWRLL